MLIPSITSLRNHLFVKLLNQTLPNHFLINELDNQLDLYDIVRNNSLFLINVEGVNVLYRIFIQPQLVFKLKFKEDNNLYAYTPLTQDLRQVQIKRYDQNIGPDTTLWVERYLIILDHQTLYELTPFDFYDLLQNKLSGSFTNLTSPHLLANIRALQEMLKNPHFTRLTAPEGIYLPTLPDLEFYHKNNDFRVKIDLPYFKQYATERGTLTPDNKHQLDNLFNYSFEELAILTERRDLLEP